MQISKSPIISGYAIASQSASFCYTYVGELKMAAPREEKLICDKFNLEALTVNQVKVSKLWQTGKMFSSELKREVANRCHMRAFRYHLCLHFVDNIYQGWREGDPNRNPWLAKMSLTMKDINICKTHYSRYFQDLDLTLKIQKFKFISVYCN